MLTRVATWVGSRFAKAFQESCYRGRGGVPSSVISIVRLSNNKLSGSLGVAISVTNLMVANNLLTGNVPQLLAHANRPLESLRMFDASGNMLEGTIRDGLAVSRELLYLDISWNGARTRGIHGTLPQLLLGRTTALMFVMAAHNGLVGATPPCPAATLQVLMLHNNDFTSFSGMNLLRTSRHDEANHGSLVLLHNNRLSCSLKSCRNASAAPVHADPASLVAAGNHLGYQEPYPPWISPLEKDKLLWISGREGRTLILHFIVAGCFLVFAVIAQDSFCWLPSGLHGGPSSELMFACLQLLSHVFRAASTRVFFVILLLRSWDWYICPRTLLLASAYLREGTVAHVFVFCCWASFSFEALFLKSLTHGSIREGTAAGAAAYVRSASLWLTWIPLSMVLSSLSIISLAGESIPGFTGSSGSLMLVVVNSCIGMIQSLISSFVIPYLAEKLTSVEFKNTFAAVANLLGNCWIPAAVIVYLDPKCLGYWASFWPPCRQCSRHQFYRILGCDAFFECEPEADPDPSSGFTYLTVVLPEAICNPRYSSGLKSISHCMQHTLVRLQDIWLRKFIASGLIMPAARISAGKPYTKPAEVFGKLAVLLAYAMIASGHLPLVMPVLGLAVLGEAALVAMAMHKGSLKQDVFHDVATPTLVVALVASSIVHVASLSGDVLTSWLTISFLIVRSVLAAKAWGSHSRRNT